MWTSRTTLTKTLFIAALAFVLAACQSTMRQIKDCKQGDWSLIGNKDGAKGLPANYEERRSFCAGVDSDKIKAESATLYQTGWEAGNHQLWQKLGMTDGAFPRPSAYFEQQVHSEAVREHKTPLNQRAYLDGWTQGNANYWRSIGDQDGVAGQAASYEQQRQANAGDIPFNASAYQEAWRVGNQAYWTRLGYLDAKAGVSDAMLAQHRKAAEAKAVLVRPDAYQLAWDAEIIEYWKRLGWDDATQGADRYMRRVDAKTRGLKFEEAAYQSMWEKRLQEYWADAGRDDGFGKPQRIEERMANARNDKVFVLEQTRDIYLQAWHAENARYCSPENAFGFGRASRYFEWSVCTPQVQARARNAYESGQKYQTTLRDKERVERDLRETLDYRNDLDHQIRHLHKESHRDQSIIKENKDKTAVEEANKREKRRDHELRDLARRVRDANDRLDVLESRRFRLEDRLDQLQRGI